MSDSTIMPWHFYFMKDGWISFTEDGNEQMNAALSQEPLPEKVTFKHKWGKRKTTEYTVNLVFMKQRQDNGTQRNIQAYWNDDPRCPFEWEKAKAGWRHDKEQQELPQADGASPWGKGYGEKRPSPAKVDWRKRGRQDYQQSLNRIRLAANRNPLVSSGNVSIERERGTVTVKMRLSAEQIAEAWRGRAPHLKKIGH